VELEEVTGFEVKTCIFLESLETIVLT